MMCSGVDVKVRHYDGVDRMADDVLLLGWRDGGMEGWRIVCEARVTYLVSKVACYLFLNKDAA